MTLPRRESGLIYLHLVRDEKFIAGAIRLFEAVAPGRNRWIRLDGEEKARHLPGGGIEQMTAAEFRRQDFSGTIVLIHRLDRAARSVLFSTANARFVWIAWGADFYGELLGTALFGPKTRRLAPPPPMALRRKLRRRFRRALFEHLPKRLVALVSRRRPNSFFGAAREAPLPAVIRQCHGIIFVVPTEAALVRERFPRLRLRTFSWNYFAFDGQRETPDPIERGPACAALIGNSASAPSNHLECLELAAGVSRGLDLYVPLSYGDLAYRERLRAALPGLPQHRLHLLEDFLPLDEYQRIMSRCCYVVMGHKRQQAMGNILYALAVGARVYLDPDNPIYGHFRGEGAVIFTLEEFPRDAQEGAGWLDGASAERNRDIVLRLHGWTASVERTRALLQALEASAG